MSTRANQSKIIGADYITTGEKEVKSECKNEKGRAEISPLAVTEMTLYVGAG